MLRALQKEDRPLWARQVCLVSLCFACPFRIQRFGAENNTCPYEAKMLVNNVVQTKQSRLPNETRGGCVVEWRAVKEMSDTRAL